MSGVSRVQVELPGRHAGPIGHIAWRIALAVALVLFVAVLTYVGREGYVDPEDDSISVLDALYYSTVSITTTGYGDIRPVTDSARLVTTLLVTPARVLFLILLVGTTLELLAERSREAYRRTRWRQNLKDHTIICGFGTKGATAAKTLVDKGIDPAKIVVLDENPGAREEATSRDLAAVAGSGASSDALLRAGIREANAVVVAVDRDDTAVLVTLTARELNPEATIVASVREEENVHLLKQSGADSVVTSSGAAGRLLGHAVDEPRMTEVLEDLLQVGEGLDLEHFEITEADAGPISLCRVDGPVVGVIRGEDLMRFDDPRAQEVEVGDQVVYLHSNRRSDD